MRINLRKLFFKALYSFAFLFSGLTDLRAELPYPVGIESVTWAPAFAFVSNEGRKFNIDDHIGMLKAAVREGSCSERISRLIWKAEVTVPGQTDGALHFLNDIDVAVKALQDNVLALNSALRNSSIEAAEDFLAKVLHATQSFYAHTNFLELLADQSRSLDTGNLAIRPWRDDFKKNIEQLKRNGLTIACERTISIPVCKNSLERSQIDKSGNKGKQVVDAWNITLKAAAEKFAYTSTKEYLEHLNKDSLFLSKMCPSTKIMVLPVAP